MVRALRRKRIRQFSDPTPPIVVAVDECFTVVLEGNPTTGYRWEAATALPYLEILDHGVRPRGHGIGAGGHEIFQLHALQAGETEIVLEYRRPWGGEALHKRRFEVRIR